MLAASAVLLGVFVVIESRAAHPLLPLRVLRDRTRGGSYLAIGLSGIAMFAVFLFLTYYLQRSKGFSPIETGLAFLPMSAAIIVTATSVNIVFLPRVGPRALLTLGMVLGAGAMVWLAQVTPTSSYVSHILPALLVMGVGMGNIFAPAIASATYGVEPHDTGVASAMVNTMQQIGGSIGTALLSSIFASAVTAYSAGGQAAHAAARGRGRGARVHRRVLGRGRCLRLRRDRGRHDDAQHPRRARVRGGARARNRGRGRAGGRPGVTRIGARGSLHATSSQRSADWAAHLLSLEALRGNADALLEWTTRDYCIDDMPHSTVSARERSRREVMSSLR